MSSTPRAPITPTAEKSENAALKPMSAAGLGVGQIAGGDTTASNSLLPSKSTAPGRPRMHKRSATGFIPLEGGKLDDVFPPGGNEDVWRRAIKAAKPKNTLEDIEASIVQHVQSTLSRSAYNVDQIAIYQATALSCRDRLIERWNATQMYHTVKKPKRVYYLSLEFLMGRSLDNALLNLQVKDKYSEATSALGFNMEDLLDSERDAGLGNGGLGRLAACYMDSLSTVGIPAWGYGLRYHYGIFQQMIGPNGEQIEAPDPWLDSANPWEIPRLDTSYTVRMFGQAQRGEGGKGPGKWTGGWQILAVPYDVPIPGYGKSNVVNNIRMWTSKARRSFDLDSFNRGDYGDAVSEADAAENITRVLYPNDNTMQGKELRLQQQYFWTAASLQDIIRRFEKLEQPWSEFSQYNAIQLNDTHPTLAILEFMRLLVDEKGVKWDEAWQITQATFGYTNHTVLPEALEKWAVPLVQHLLPRHMQIAFDLNLDFLQAVERKHPGDRELLSSVSLIEEGHPQQLRMANLAIIGSHKVNGVAALHSRLVKEMFKPFVDFFGPDKFTNVTNGITPRRWLLQCNPALAALITKTLGSDDWLTDLPKIERLVQFADDKGFQKAFLDCKLANKARLAQYITRTTGLEINPEALFDIQVKRIHEYKRQFMNILGCIWRYLELKKMSPAERKKVVKRVSIFAGKSAPGYAIAKQIIRLINSVSKVVNADKDIGDAFQVVFLADYSVSLAEIIVPASDISEHISTAGTEASGTSNMKFALNGGIILGTVDGANVEIGEAVGDDQVFFFGHLADDIGGIRHTHYYKTVEYPREMLDVADAIRSGTFGDPNVFSALLDTVFGSGRDYYCLADDFNSYLAAQKLIDEEFVKKESWLRKCILTTARMGRFSSDRCVQEYSDEIWNASELPVPLS